MYLFHLDAFVAKELLGDGWGENVFNFADPFHEEVEEFSANLDQFCIFGALDDAIGTVIFFSGTGGIYMPGHFLTMAYRK